MLHNGHNMALTLILPRSVAIVNVGCGCNERFPWGLRWAGISANALGGQASFR